MNGDDVTVIITVHDDDEFVATAIESVLSQTVSPGEVVIVDAASTDDSRDVIASYASESDLIVPVFLEEDPGIPAMRNVGLDHATGQLITFLDGDDAFEPEKLETELKRVRETDPETRVVFSNYQYVDDQGVPLREWATTGPPPTGSVLRHCLMREWPRGSLFRSELVPRALMQEVGAYDESLEIYEDWDLKIRLAAASDVAYCPEVLSAYRRHGGGISQRATASDHLAATRYIYEKHASLLDQLDETGRQDVESALEKRMSSLAALAAFEEHGQLAGARRYLQHLLAHPSDLTGIRTHVRFFLPRSIQQVLRDTRETRSPQK